MNGFEYLAPAARGADPASQSFDHVVTQFFVGDKPGGGPAPGLGGGHVLGVDPLDARPDGVVGQPLGEGEVEIGDGFIGRGGKGAKCRLGGLHCGFGDAPLPGGDQEHLLGGLHDDHRVAGLKVLGDGFGDAQESVAAEENWRSGFELGEFLAVRHGGQFARLRGSCQSR